MKLILLIATFAIALNSFAQTPGSLDPQFGNSGKVILSINNGADKATGVVMQPDNKILVSAYTYNSITGNDFSIIRFLPNGDLDSTFSNDGIASFDLQLGSDDIANSIALQTDGKIIIAGSTDNGSNKDAAIIRVNSSGSIDSTFGTNGITITDFENSVQDDIRCIKLNPLTGSIVAGGQALITSNTAKPVVARYLSNGVIDSTFNTTGIKLLWITSLDYQYLFSVEDILILPNGKITATGWRDFPNLAYDADYWLGRINADGSMDVSFSTDGVNVFNGAFNGTDKSYSLTLDASNNILVAGGGSISSIYSDFTMLEISSNGSTGSTVFTTDYNSLYDDVAYSLKIDNDGKYVLAGTSSNGSNESFAIARVTSSTSADNTFGTNGKVTTTFAANLVNHCSDATIQADNKIVAVGYTNNDIAIARYLGDTIPQLNAFQLSTPANNAVNQVYTSLVTNWTDALGATGFILEVDTNSSFLTSTIYSTVASTKTLTNLLQSTIYYWRVKSFNSTDTSAYTSAWNFTTGMAPNGNIDLSSTNIIAVYPNPCSDNLIIDLANALVIQRIDIINNLGQIVRTYNSISEHNILALNNLAIGIYAVRLVGENTEVNRSFVIQR